MIGRKLNIDHRYYSFSDNFPYSFETWDLQNGRIPMISWDATGVTLDAINAGKYDTYFRDRATALKNLGHPVFLRPMYEMNGDWMDWDGYHNNTPGTTDGPAKYVQAWRRMHDIFMTVGATNVGWVWAPNSESVPADTWNDFRNYYPGDGYVDWVGVDGYNWGTSQTWSSWQSFASIFSNVYNAYAAIKPIMIAETSSCEAGGSKANWISDAAAAIKSMPAIHAIVWFNENMECDWRVNTSQSALDAFKAIGADAYFNPR
jgi:beta-mannanase